MVVLHARFAKQEKRFQANSAVVHATNAIVERSAVLGMIVQIARLALTQIQRRRNAYSARRVLGAALSGQVMAQHVATVLLEDTRRQRV